jgi:hypothetical protein
LDWKQSAATLRRFGVTGLLRRTVSYRAQENDHYAFAEFAWNPDLSAEDFADRYVTRSLRRKDPITVEVYCEWIKARHYAGSLRLLQELRDQPFSSKPIDREYPRLLADSLKALSGSLETAPRSELMEGIRTAFVEQKPELLALV